MKMFTTPDGVEWRVWSVIPGHHTGNGRTGRHLPDDMMEGWLCFECDNEKRRFYPLPEGWEEHEDDQLHVLLECAVRVEPVTSQTLVTS